VGRVAGFVVRLTPYGVFAIAAHAAGTLSIDKVARLEVYLLAYVVFAVLLSLWVLPGLIAALTPVGAMESLRSSRDALLTAFLVGDLFIVLPALMAGCSDLIDRRFRAGVPARELPSTIVPVSFTFPHSGKLLSLSFVFFAGWFSDSAVPAFQYLEVALAGFLSLFGSMNAAIPYLLDLCKIPADTFQLFLATGVINSRFGTLLAAVHTIAVCLIGGAAVTGAIRFQPARLLRFLAVTILLTTAAIAGLRTGFSRFVDMNVDGRQLVYGMQPLTTSPVEQVLQPDEVDPATIPPPDQVLDAIRLRGTLRVGIIADGIPYAFRNRDERLVGFDIEMAQRLAADLGVQAQFVRFPQHELVERIRSGVVDIVMTGARLTPERAAEFQVAVPYLEETLAVITLDHNREKFRSWSAMRETEGLRIGVQNLPYYIATIRRLLPEARLEVIEETKELIDPEAPYDAYLLPAERGSVLTMLNPRFTVVVPEGVPVKMPLAYPLAGNDPDWIRFVNTWIELKKGDGFVQALYDHWILGRAVERAEPRWSVIRDVLHWVT
jgi:ABC-type amino acid transport substrate-binding protein